MIYTGQLTVTELVGIMKTFAGYGQQSTQFLVYSCMVNNLFDECRFFPKYPAAELITTGRLFVSLVAEDLVPQQTLGLALRCILEALRRPLQSKMFKFGVLALEQVLAKLASWPQLCVQLRDIAHLREAYPVYVQYAERILAVLPENLKALPIVEAKDLKNLRIPPCPGTQPEPDLAAMGSKPGPPSSAPPDA